VDHFFHAIGNVDKGGPGYSLNIGVPGKPSGSFYPLAKHGILFPRSSAADQEQQGTGNLDGWQKRHFYPSLPRAYPSNRRFDDIL
jgi:hypothetical protein